LTLLGVDVSHYQASGNSAWWKTASAAGISFGVAKAGESLSYRDPTFGSNVTGMKSAGVLPGGYWFLRSGNASGQADLLIDTISGVNGGSTTGMLCALDAEDGSWADVNAFVARFKARQSRPLLIYTGGWYWSGRIGNPDGSGLGPLWHSRYPTATPASPKTQWDALGAAGRAAGFVPGYGRWQRAAVWQFSHNARIGGITCDANAFEGSAQQLAALAGTTNLGGLNVADAASIEKQLAYVQAQLKSTAQLVVDGNNAVLAKVAALAGLAPSVDIDALAAKIVAGLPPGTVFDPNVVETAVRKVLIEGTGGTA
jgi:lysozyme